MLNKNIQNYYTVNIKIRSLKSLRKKLHTFYQILIGILILFNTLPSITFSFNLGTVKQTSFFFNGTSATFFAPSDSKLLRCVTASS